MGKRDYRWKEPKKAKKGAKKIVDSTEIIPSPTTVEVVKKRKEERPTEE